MIRKPYLLADIQQDLTGIPGNVLATDVLAVAGSKKRKRSELALAIDRQGINIYDVSLRSKSKAFLNKLIIVKDSVVKADYIVCDISPGCLYLPTMLHSITPVRE